LLFDAGAAPKSQPNQHMRPGLSSASQPGKRPAMSPPFNAKEITRFFVWIAILAVAIAIIVWFILYSPAHQSVHPTRKSAALHQRLPQEPSPGIVSRKFVEESVSFCNRA
jgi:hypothetical protein